MANSPKLPPGVRLTRAGQYQVRYTGPDGRRYSGGTYRTKTDATNALAIIKASISNRTWKARKAIVDGELSGKSSLEAWSEEWIKTRSSRKTGEPLSALTVRNYRRTISAGLALFQNRAIDSITSVEIRKWWTGYRVEYTRAANNAYKYLNALLSLAVKRGALYENPCDIEGASTYVPKPKGKLATNEQVNRLIEETEYPWKAFFAVAIYGGLRRGEIAELRVGDVVRNPDMPDRVALDIQRSVRWITNSETEVGRPKSMTGIRSVPLGLTASKILDGYLATRPAVEDDLLFSRDSEGRVHLNESTIRNETDKARQRFGIKESLHRLRDYSLTLYAQQGATLQEILKRGGHSNIRAAMAYQRDAGRDWDLANWG